MAVRVFNGDEMMRQEFESELIKKYRQDAIVNRAIQAGEYLGETREETLCKLVIMLINMKDEAFQEKIDEAMRQVHSPIVMPMSEYLARARKND